MAGDERTFYEHLGLTEDASQAEVRAAFRRLVLRFHPDRNKGPEAHEHFLEVSRAFEVLSDPARRKEYDRLLQIRGQFMRRAAAGRSGASREPAVPKRPAPKPSKADPRLAADVARLKGLFAKGRFGHAEALARQIIDREPRHPAPYAILGDIARARGQFDVAVKLYAYAVQMDPRDPESVRKYEELISGPISKAEGRHAANRDGGTAAVAAGFGLTLVAAAYIATASEPALFRGIPWVSTWTLGLVAMLLSSGVALGASLALGGLLDRFATYAMAPSGRLSPSVALLFVAIINFWAATALYVQAGWIQKSFHFATTRLLTACAGAVLILALAASASARIQPMEVLLFGGNLVYLGAICGWMTADSLRR